MQSPLLNVAEAPPSGHEMLAGGTVAQAVGSSQSVHGEPLEVRYSQQPPYDALV
jgi:hypothetical protein